MPRPCSLTRPRLTVSRGAGVPVPPPSSAVVASPSLRDVYASPNAIGTRLTMKDHRGHDLLEVRVADRVAANAAHMDAVVDALRSLLDTLVPEQDATPPSLALLPPSNRRG